MSSLLPSLRSPLAVVACVLCATAAASDWANMGMTNEAIVFVDHETVTRNGHLVTAWFLINYLAPRTDGANRRHASSRRLAVFDCFQSSYATLERQDYAEQNAKGGRVAASGVPLASAEFTRAEIDSLPYKVLRQLCR